MFNEQEVIRYASIVNGKIAVSSSALNPKAETITTKEGKQKYYLFYKSVTARIVGLNYKAPPEDHQEWSWNWIIKLQSGDELCNLQLNFGSSYALTFFSILPNIDLNEPVEIQPYMKEEIYEGKKREKRGMFIRQNGNTLKWYYTKENSADMPAVEVIKKKSGKVEYDDFERNEFFKKLVKETNLKLAGIKQTKEEMQPETLEDDDPLDEAIHEANTDGLPF